MSIVTLGLGLHFILELCALAAMAFAGFRLGDNLAMRLLNEDLDRGLRLWEAFDEGGATHELFTWDMPELRVFLHGPGIIGLEFGTHGPPGDIVVWHAHMARTGVVERLICEGRLLEGDKPERDYEPGFNLPWGQA